MPGENLTRDEARNRAGLLSVQAYDVALDVRSAVGPAPADDRPRTFRSSTTIRFRCTEPGAGSFLDLLAPAVSAVTLNGRSLDPAAVFDGTRIELPELAAENEVTVVADCAYSRTGEGLHRFTDPKDGRVYLYTQYEPADARRVFANFEQPDLKAPFTFSVTAPADWTVLSNGAQEGPQLPVTDGQPAPDGVGTPAATWQFARTEPISTYITAVVAGPYHVERDLYQREFADGTSLQVPLGALCRASLAQHFEAADIFTVTKQGLDFFHEHFDYPYPFGKYDQVFVPEYNLGAMENPGCVTFTEDFVFRGKVTDSSYERRANVILHEMAHMWFGDLVTMEWWDDLWLKESFADFMGSLSMVESTRFSDGWITFANRRKSWAYRADQLPSTHPITADIHDLQDAKLNFDGITYAKGASVLKQLVAYVGRDAFFEGSRRYFKRHAYQNTRLADLLAVLEESSGRDMAAWSRAWLQTAGLNALTPEASYDATGRITELAVLQEAPAEYPTLRPHRVAVGLYRLADDALERYARVEVDVVGARTAVPELAGAEQPDLILVNDDDLTYCKTRFDGRSLDTLREHLGALRDPLARAQCWTALWGLTRDALLPARDFLALTRRFAGVEGDVGMLEMVHSSARSALTHYVTPARRDAERAEFAEVALRELRAAEPASGHQLAWAYCFASLAGAESDFHLLRDLLAGSTPAGGRIDGLTDDQELRWAFVSALAAGGAADEEMISAEVSRDDTASGRQHAAYCRAALPSAEVKRAAWESVVESDALSNALIGATLGGFSQPGQRDLLAPYTPRYFAVIERLWQQRSITIGMSIVRGLFPALQSEPATLEATDAWLAEHPDAAPALRRLVLEGRDDLARAVNGQARDAAAEPRG